MFRTDINHWLQQWDHSFVYWFFEGVSALGTALVLIVLLYSIMIGVDLKKGFGIANMFFYVILLTLLFKSVVDYPRPMAVDTTLNGFGRKANTENLTKLQPEGYFDTFSEPLLQKIRNQKAAREGFPSGHTSLITAIMFGLALIFRRRWLSVLSATIIVLMMFSRMYLARHYLGDVLGGLVVGLLFTYLVYIIWQRIFSNPKNSNATAYFMLSPLVLVPLYTWFPAFPAGTFIGLNLGYLAIQRIWGNPVYSPQTGLRIASVAVFAFIAFLSTYINRRLGFPEYGLVSLLLYIVFSMISFLSAAFVCVQAKWWEFE
ncbi:hypothetical protein BKI52_22725 [marine bacterium AO1-C]|nr:hypothetical protein BKI52_22725 [marine bacterium AO1-C]